MRDSNRTFSSSFVILEIQIITCAIAELSSSFFRLLPLYFPRDKQEEDVASTKLPPDVGDENGETVITERKIRISALPGTAQSPLSPKWSPPVSGDVTPYYRPSAAKRFVILLRLTSKPTLLASCVSVLILSFVLHLL